MSKALALAMAILVLAHAAVAVEDVSEQAKAFLKKNTTDAARAKWRKNFVDPGANIPGDMYDQTKMLDILKNWLVKFKGSFDEKDKRPKIQQISLENKIEMCEWFLLFHEKGWALPQVAPYDEMDKFITAANFKEWIDPQAQAPTVAQDKQ